jgi:hypothetical protein
MCKEESISNYYVTTWKMIMNSNALITMGASQKVDIE